MILEFNQVKRQPDPLFEGRINGKLVVSGRGASHSQDAYLLYENQRIDMPSKIHREKYNEKTITQVVDYYKGDERYAFIFPGVVPLKKILFMSIGYDYFQLVCNDKIYMIYEVGFGENQHYICVYSNEQLIAVIHKIDRVINFKDQYMVYALDQKDLLPLSMITLYFDCVRYPDFGEVAGETNITDDSYLSVQKELNDKFDPEFIPRVKAMDGVRE